MVVLGVVLILVGVALLVAEAHVPAGVLGGAGGISLTLGTVIAMAASGAGAAAIVPVAVGAGAIACLWVAIAARKSLETLGRRPSSGREALSGRAGVVRNWAGANGQVLVDGALWQARPSMPDEAEDLHAGDAVVVERVSGLTLGVRRAEEWEAPW